MNPQPAFSVRIAVSMNRDVQAGDGSVAEALGRSLRMHEEAWARRVGEALTDLQAATQIGLLSH